MHSDDDIRTCIRVLNFRSLCPHDSSLYALVEDYYEKFERVYDDRYRQQYGYWRPVIGEVMREYPDCGDLHRGFARLGCNSCRYQAILAYSCKCRLFCPSCQQKRVLLYADMQCIPFCDSNLREFQASFEFNPGLLLYAFQRSFRDVSFRVRSRYPPFLLRILELFMTAGLAGLVPSSSLSIPIDSRLSISIPA